MKKRVTFTIDEEILKQLKDISKRTLIPQARLVEKAVINVIDSYKDR